MLLATQKCLFLGTKVLVSPHRLQHWVLVFAKLVREKFYYSLNLHFFDQLKKKFKTFKNIFNHICSFCLFNKLLDYILQGLIDFLLYVLTAHMLFKLRTPEAKMSLPILQTFLLTLSMPATKFFSVWKKYLVKRHFQLRCTSQKNL